jgi:DNA-binding transcriptional MerR regulator
MMRERELKIGDIAQITGLSEQDVRMFVQKYDGLFTYRTIGKVKLFPPKAVDIVRDIVALSGKDLSPEEITEEIRHGAKQSQEEEPSVEVPVTGAPLPPEVVLDFRIMQETLANQQRQISRLTAELDDERTLRQTESRQAQQSIEGLQEQLDGMRRQLAIVADWVDYFDARMDECARPLSERVKRSLGRSGGSG